MSTPLSENYILNPLIEIKGYQELKATLNKKKDDLASPTVKKIKKGKLFLLSGRTKDLLINDTIKTFLSLFHVSTTLEKVSHSFAQFYNTSPDKVLPTLDSFFKDMRFQGILVPLSAYEELVQIKEEDRQNERADVFTKGETIRQYRILDLICQKPKFDIYLAERIKDRQQVVLKTLYFPKELKKKEKKERKVLLRQEFKLLEEVTDHPNICQFYGFHKNKGQAIGVMEYIAGWSLKRYLKKQKPSLSQKIDLIQQLFDAVAHVHKCGIVHGDIHNSNFIINQQHRVKLFDFDLANHHQLHKNEIERIGGVYKYFPPEKIRKNSFSYLKAKADYRSEVYQVSIVAYYLLYERFPFKALTWRKLAEQIKNIPPVLPTHTPQQEPIPPTYLKILKKALSKQPKNRFKSAIVLGERWVDGLMG